MSHYSNKANIEGFATYKNKKLYSNQYKRKDKKLDNPETNDNTEVSTNETVQNYYEVTIIGGDEPTTSSTSTIPKINQTQKRKSQSFPEYTNKMQKLDLISKNDKDENNWKSKYFLIFDQNCKLVKSYDQHVQHIKKLENHYDKLKKELKDCKKELKTCKEKLNKYDPVSVVNEEEFQINYETACSSHDYSYKSTNELQSTLSNELQSTLSNGIPSTFSNEIPITVVSGAHSTLEVQQCDELSSNSVVTFDKVVLENNKKTTQHPSNQELKSEVDLLKQQLFEMHKFISSFTQK